MLGLLSPGRELGEVSVGEAAKSLGVNVRMVPILLSHGCLSATPDDRAGSEAPARCSRHIYQVVPAILSDDGRDRAVARHEQPRCHVGAARSRQPAGKAV